MNQQQLQIFTSLWALPLLIPIISGVGRILGGQVFLEVAMVTYWIFQTLFLLDEFNLCQKLIRNNYLRSYNEFRSGGGQ